MHIESGHAVLHAVPGRPFRVLQLTDFHNDVSDELTARTCRDVEAMVRQFCPDLLAVTGDIWCGEDKPELAPELMRRDLEFLESLGIPWAFTWGNHDYCGNWEVDSRLIASAPHAVAPKGDGQGNYRIEVRALSDAAWDLYFLNSRAWSFLPGDLEWLEAEAGRVRARRGLQTPAIAFFHIPLEQYEIARVEGRVTGIALEDVAFWGNTRECFEPFRRVGTIKACFVGHSHVNDYYVEEDGIVLAYGRATGYGGYGDGQLRKGAKLLELDLESQHFEFRTVFADGSEEGLVERGGTQRGQVSSQSKTLSTDCTD